MARCAHVEHGSDGGVIEDGAITFPSRRGDYEDADFYREQVENEERLAGLRRT